MTIKSTEIESHAPALVLVQHLSLFSMLPLIAAYRKFGLISIRYVVATPRGLWLASWLARIGLAYGHPVKISDLLLIDTQYNRNKDMKYRALVLCQAKLSQVGEVIDGCFPRASQGYRTICPANVIKSWAVQLRGLMLLCNVARLTANETGVQISRIAIISSDAKLLEMFAPDIYQAPVAILCQPALHNSLLFAAKLVLLTLLRVFAALGRKLPAVLPLEKRVGVTATWGANFGSLNDFSWWRKSDIPAERLVYLFVRSDHQATLERVQKARSLGVQSTVLNHHALGEAPHLLMEGRQTLSEALRTMFLTGRLAVCALFSDYFVRSVVTSINWQNVNVTKLAATYKELGLRAVLHYQEVGADKVALAAELAGAIRFGFQWSCFDGPCEATVRTHQVFFLWSQREAQICLDSGSVSRFMLISGCPLNEMRTNGRHHQDAECAVTEMRRQGVKYILALFDSSTPTLRFYRFFLQWLVGDPMLGLLVKSKKYVRWTDVQADGLDGLVQCALTTGRVYVLDPSASPSDAAVASNFAVGINSLSAVVVSALAGARVLYLDYERLDQGSLKWYATLHSLGPNRCVFHDHETLRQAVLDYVRDPSSNPHLGDAAPVLDQFDSFRDGKASQRIGEYIRWYLECLDEGLNRDEALKRATHNYADRWGADKIARGL